MTDYVGACYGMYFAEVADFTAGRTTMRKK